MSDLTREVEFDLIRAVNLLGYSYGGLDAGIKILLARLSAMERALAFYANPDGYRWGQGEPYKRGVIQAEDKGQVASRALGGPPAKGDK